MRLGIKYSQQPAPHPRGLSQARFRHILGGISLVRVALRNFRNKTGFHECPRCKSRSVWKTDLQSALEDALHLLLNVSPYRCARCDQRFMDAKASAAEVVAPPRTTGWLAAVPSVG